ncbi:hypothetical protein C8N35_1168 [Breoghania corrubedonensis]|uniref:Uncharacterized protein n=1 Tax=Breoghania corrubedonensis TaxID=665038 RepID=A0A2T5UPY2_9HYPH|nr:hypothetical protein [Breoghania corrubedonensis]PTW53553.1 hypothetical protein C8N35_1168 [Breoghania corrubedonensis]
MAEREWRYYLPDLEETAEGDLDPALDPRIGRLLKSVGPRAKKILQQIGAEDMAGLAQLNRLLVGDVNFGTSTTLYCLRDHTARLIDAARHSWAEPGLRTLARCGGRTATLYWRCRTAYDTDPRSMAAFPLGKNLIVLEAVEHLSERDEMKNPNPVNLLTPEESRAGGWQAESRDEDGHLCTQQAPFFDDEEMVEYVNSEIARGKTVTIWPPADGHTRPEKTTD